MDRRRDAGTGPAGDATSQSAPAAADRFHEWLEPSQWLFRQGEPGDCAWIIESGSVEILVGADESRIAVLQAGEILGEMALIDGRPRTASVRALSAVRLRRVTARHFTERLAQADPILRVLLKGIVSRYRDALVPDTSAPDVGPDEHDRREALARIELEQALALALERGHFDLHYQPIVDLRTRRTAGFEALLRWNCPVRGAVPPAEFIPVAEASDLIVDIGRWALSQAGGWLASLPGSREAAPPFVALNLSPRQLRHPHLRDDLDQVVRRFGLGAERIKLEITETLLMEDFEQAAKILSELRAGGFPIAVDDFGTGYSSLAYLHRFPVDTLKIDRSFVSRLVDDGPSRSIVGAIAHLADALQMDVVAEGVETADQAAVLESLGVRYAQGYAFSRPQPASRADELLWRSWHLTSDAAVTASDPNDQAPHRGA